MLNQIVIYTDGSALGNPGPGGFGVVMKYNAHRLELSDGFRLTTNNRMELLAVIVALSRIKQPDLKITIYTDSKYVCNAITEGWLFNWRRKGWAKVKNVDLWQQFLPLYEKHKPHFEWVKGHAGIPENERCDQLATTAAANGPHHVDKGYESSVDSGNNLL